MTEESNSRWSHLGFPRAKRGKQVTRVVAPKESRHQLSTLLFIVGAPTVPATDSMPSISNREALVEAESLFAEQVSRVELLGEIQITEQSVDSLCRAFGSLGLDASRGTWPHCFAACLVGVARFRYDGDAFWPHFRDAFAIPALHAPQQQEVGQWFERYLSKNRLPRFAHLVEQGALRYLTPILAHALVPRALVPDFMEMVIWPATEDPERHGATGEEIQQLLARWPAQMPRSLHRFIVHGGGVARDLIDRSLAVATAVSREQTPDVALPAWLSDEITWWVKGRSNSQRQRAASTRARAWRSPAVRFDPVYGRIQLEIPFVDERDAAWEVHRPGLPTQRFPWKPAWERTGSAESVLIDRPFATMTVSLESPSRTLGQRRFDGLTTTRPCMFFDARTHRLVGASGYLPNGSWYVVTPEGSELFADHERLLPRESLGEPLGVWQRLTVEYYEAFAAAELTVIDPGGGKHVYRLIDERSDAELQVPALPQFLAPVADGMLAFESDLPTILLPPSDGQDEAAYLKRWSVRLQSDSGAEEVRRNALDLEREQRPNGSFLLRIEELVPGPDVGDWVLEVQGPLGRGFVARLSLLPAMEFQISDRPGIAGPELAPSSVFVATRDGIRVLESEDVASPALSGWVLHDRNRNGRIPFTVEDTRTGRETSGLIRLNTVQWRWLIPGTPATPENTPHRISLDLMDPQAPPRLLASNPGPNALRLRLLDPVAGGLQEELLRPRDGRGATFSLASFLTTAGAAPSPTLRLQLELADTGGVTLSTAVVGVISRDIVPADTTSQAIADETRLTFRLPRSFPGAVGRIASLSRPWTPTIDAPVTIDSQGRSAIIVPRLVPGRYELTLWHDDGWAGLATLGAGVEIQVGSADDLLAHRRDLPPTAAARLEDILLDVEVDPRSALRDLGNSLGPHQLAELVGCVAAALEQGRPTELLSLPWWEMAAALAEHVDDPLPLLETVAQHAGTRGLSSFCVAIGLDRWPAMGSYDAPDSLSPALWSGWMPLGAIADLRRAREAAEPAARCRESLGWAPGDDLVCEKCGAVPETEGWCGGCETNVTIRRPRSLPDSGRVGGPEFRPEPARLAAIRNILLPVPCTPFAPDGWVADSLAALEELAQASSGSLSSERDSWITAYRKHVAQHEGQITALLRRNGLDRRQAGPKAGPWYIEQRWAYVSRMSLAVALTRRLLAWRRMTIAPETAACLDELAAWLQRRLGRIYERDLCFAEMICCREFAHND